MAKKTICFVGSQEIEDLLKRMSAEDDRSMSSFLRTIILREAQRRQQAQQPEQKPVTQQPH